MSRLVRTALAGVTASALLVAAPAAACECVASDPAYTFATTDVVFEGTATAIKDLGAEQEISLSVGRRWKAPKTETVTVRVWTGKRCGYVFERGRTYLVFAMKEGEAIRASACSATAPIDQAGETLKKLPSPWKTPPK